jgi:hypothetical protein
MLTIFKSPACGDVIMFAQNGKEMLSVLGKYPEDAKGIVTLEQLPAAIAALKDAIETDKAKPVTQQVKSDGPLSDDDVRFQARAIPLLEMLERSLKDKVPVTWGV